LPASASASCLDDQRDQQHLEDAHACKRNQNQIDAILMRFVRKVALSLAIGDSVGFHTLFEVTQAPFQLIDALLRHSRLMLRVMLGGELLCHVCSSG
jgi:hypothetical protein